MCKEEQVKGISMKNSFTKFLAVIFLVSLSGIFTACGNDKKSAAESKEKIKIVTTIYPIYEWVKNIVQDKADVQLLISSGTDLHSWQPAMKDIALITGDDTDLFIYNGGESDFWVKKLIPKMEANGVQYFSVMKENVALLEPMGEHHHERDEYDEYAHDEDGDHDEYAHDEDHDEADDHDEAEEFDPDEYDEHIWLSVKRMPLFVNSLAEKIAEVDEANADFYLSNAHSYASECSASYKKYSEHIENLSNKTIVIADRNPFVYLASDLGLEVYAAFHGCSADSEASFDVVVGLVNVIEEKNIGVVVCCDVKNRIAETIDSNVKSRKLDIVVLDSMQAKISDDRNYNSIMIENLEKIKKILSTE